MQNIVIIAIAAAVIIVALVLAWIISANRSRVSFLKQLSQKDEELIRKDAQARTAEALRASDKEQYEKTLAELKAGQEKAIEAAKNALVLESEKILKAREQALKEEAAETMKAITGGLDQNIKDMKEAFEAQKKTHAEESSSIKTQFAETVRHLKEQTDTIGNKAENLASALKGKNKMQGIFGETILENILKAEGLREGHDYEAEIWLRDKKGNIIQNEETGRKMRPDFALHFPDDTDILIDSKVSLSALSDYFEAETDEQRADASRRNLESVMNHIKELTGKEYQKYVVGRKTLEYVIMFIPNYGAYQLAKQEDPEIFAKAFSQNVLITTEETLIPFLRLIRTAWVQKEQMENISEIVDAAQNMVDRVALFCEKNAEVEHTLEVALKKFKDNSARLNTSPQSIVGAAWKAVNHGIKQPAGHILPQLGPAAAGQEEAS
ncbi:MAG: DNA recombination protein RmuC [Bacteroidales bacterium]|nr:DNA recombination protein RmuC [Bacteroidales bacterium]MBQ2544391.1 DNA recombination protein RmuC [Bacteroidales bacterium]